MKPHEETWRVKRGVLVAGEGDEWDTNVFYEKNLDAPEHLARVQLAAQAPAMARLLAKIRSTYVPDADEAKEIELVLKAAGATDALPDWCRSFSGDAG